MILKWGIFFFLSVTLSLADTLENREYHPERPQSYQGCAINPEGPAGFELLEARTGLPVIYNHGHASLPQRIIKNLQPLHFSKPDKGPRGVYDITVKHDGRTYYLAIFKSGKVGWSTCSSHGQHYITEGHGDFITTIFSMSCSGHVTAGILGGHRFRFDIVKHNLVLEKKGHSGKKEARDITPEGFYVLPKNLPPRGPSRKRCPADQRAITRNPGTPVTTNGCGTDTGIGSFVPELDFHKCCNGHDRCYGTCSTTFDGCNTDFLNCNVAQCDRKYKDGTLRHWVCVKVAHVYGNAVTGSIGVKAFTGANREFCKCKCKDKTKKRCNRKCIDITSDPNNCGDCNFKCPSKKCKNGACAFKSCDGSVCGSFGSCGPGGSCVCASIVDHSGFCVNGDIPCEGLAGCSTSEGCPIGSVCAAGSCCERNVCVSADSCGGFNRTSKVLTHAGASSEWTFARRPNMLL